MRDGRRGRSAWLRLRLKRVKRSIRSGDHFERDGLRLEKMVIEVYR